MADLYTNVLQGFNVGYPAAIDKRILMSKSEMKNAEELYNLPDNYFCLCSEDGKFYIFNVNNGLDDVTGKYRVIDEKITFSSPAAISALNEAIKQTVTITDLQTKVTTLEGTVTTLEGRVNVLEPKVTTLETKVNEVLEPKVNDLEPRVAKAEIDITDIETWINNVKLDGGEIKSEYDVSENCTHVVKTGTHPTKVAYMTSAAFTYTAETGYALPDSIKVNGTSLSVSTEYRTCGNVSAKWTKETGTLDIEKTCGNINIKIEGV